MVIRPSGAGAGTSALGGVWNGKITSQYGNRTHPVTGKADNHNGVDIASPNGTAIPSSVAGKVVASGDAKKFGYDASYGTIVVVRGGDGAMHLYAHMSSTKVKVGQEVKAGTNLGGVGSTGRSTGNHVHYNVKVDGQNVNPSTYMNGSGSSSGAKPKSSSPATVASFGGYRYADKAPKAFTQHMSSAVSKGVPFADVKGLTEMVGRESSFRSNVKNPKSTAFGYGQFLDQTRKDYKKKYPKLDYNNPVDQLVLTHKYIMDRYGSVDKALQAWESRSPHWY